MEEEIVMPKARIAFKSYAMLSAIMGFCLGLMAAIINMFFSTVRLIGGDSEVLILGILLNLIMLITGPISGIISATLSYPIYKWLINKKFTMQLIVYQLQ